MSDDKTKNYESVIKLKFENKLNESENIELIDYPNIRFSI